MADYSEYDLSDQQYVLYEEIGFGKAPGNAPLHDVFYDYYYNDFLTMQQKVYLYDQLRIMIAEEYGIDFDEVWDWEDFRAWYETAA